VEKRRKPKSLLWHHLAAAAQTTGPTAWRESAVWAAAARWRQSRRWDFSFPTPYLHNQKLVSVRAPDAPVLLMRIEGVSARSRHFPPARLAGGRGPRRRWRLRQSSPSSSAGAAGAAAGAAASARARPPSATAASAAEGWRGTATLRANSCCQGALPETACLHLNKQHSLLLGYFQKGGTHIG